MARPSKMDQELAYLRAAWEELEEQAVEHDFKTDLYMTPTISRGVWTVLAIAESKEQLQDGTPAWVERCQFRYPNGRSVTFAGELWSVMRRFTAQVAEARDKIKRTSP
jgi:hypothetical protein